MHSLLQQGCQRHAGLDLLQCWIVAKRGVWHLFRKHPARAGVPHGQGKAGVGQPTRHWPVCSGAQLQLVLLVLPALVLLPLLRLPRMLLLPLQPVLGINHDCGLVVPDPSWPLGVGQWPRAAAAMPVSQAKATCHHEAQAARGAEELPPLRKQTGDDEDAVSRAAQWNSGWCSALQEPPHHSGSKLLARRSTQRHLRRQRQRGYENRMVVRRNAGNNEAQLTLVSACKEKPSHVLQALG